MKIVFLDIDGVVNSVRSAIAFDGYSYPIFDEYSQEEILSKMDIVAIKLLQDIERHTNCKFVISSTWRKSARSVSDFDFLGLNVIGFTDRLIGMRGAEIEKFLQETNLTVDKYVIIDDYNDMLEYQLDHFVKVEGRNGFSFENYLKVLDILGVKT